MSYLTHLDHILGNVIENLINLLFHQWMLFKLADIYLAHEEWLIVTVV